MEPTYVLFGLLVGFLVGLTGIGGGSLMAPLLILAGGVPPTVAVGTDLAYGAVTKTVGGWRHLRIGTVDLGVTGWLAVGSVPGSLLGVALAGLVPVATLLVLVAAALVVAALGIIVRALLGAVRERHTVDLSAGRTRAGAVVTGFLLGGLVGVTSVGSGSLIGLVLLVLFRMTPHRVVGTDVAHAAILLWTAGLAHLASGNVDLAITAALLLGSVPGVWMGTALCARVPAAGLRLALCCVLIAAALGVLDKAGVAVPPAAVPAVPLAVGALLLLVHRLRPRPEPSPA
jgi:uncharacterized protein